MSKKQPKEQELSKVKVEIAEELDFDIGDCCIIIKPDGSIGKLILPEVNSDTVQSKGYKKMLEVVDLLKPGSGKAIDEYEHKQKRNLH